MSKSKKLNNKKKVEDKNTTLKLFSYINSEVSMKMSIKKCLLVRNAPKHV